MKQMNGVECVKCAHTETAQIEKHESWRRVQYKSKIHESLQLLSIQFPQYEYMIISHAHVEGKEEVQCDFKEE